MSDKRERPAKSGQVQSFWSPAVPVAVSDLCDALQGELAACGDRRGYRAFVTAIVDEPAIEPNGWFEVAFDDSGQRACVVYADSIRCERGGSTLATTAPRWFSAQNPVDASEAMFRALLDE